MSLRGAVVSGGAWAPSKAGHLVRPSAVRREAPRSASSYSLTATASHLIFGATDGHKFVNGILDKLAPKLRAAEVRANKR